MLDTPQHFPRAGSQSYPSPSADAAEDGSTTVWFAPEQPRRRCPRQLDPDRPEEGVLRDPAALQPAGAVLRQKLAHQRD